MVAHENVPRRFDRYALTAGYNAAINQRQFQVEGLEWPTEFRRPDETYADRHAIEVGGERFELAHAKGETDDHTWTWVPGQAHPVLRRPVHLGHAERRQPAEGAALPASTGPRRCARWRSSTPS